MMKPFIRLLFICLLIYPAFLVFSGFSSSSIYNLESNWITAQKQSVTLSHFKDNYVILSMVYTTCPHSCPMTIHKIKKIKAAIEEKAQPLKIVLATFDPKRDTPDALRDYLKKRELDDKQWIMLSAEDEATPRELSAALNINYKQLPDGEFAHSNVIVLLNKEGRIMARVDSLSADIDVFVQAVNKMHQ